ncbi:hypothetical protein FACS1894105_11610 [Clostridia bacterium]|nr:hypothetical protein FACS1894105_11610 [Clostridia bacterium]
MKMHGRAKLQLIDAKTGRPKFQVEKDNLVTNAINQFFSSAKLPFLWGGNADVFSDRVSSLSMLLPIPNGTVGGLLLFNDTLEESSDNVSTNVSKKLVGHAGGVYSGDSIYRGTLSTADSGPITNGYRYVFSFPTNAANGEIKSLSLTSLMGGNTATGYFNGSNDVPDYGSTSYGTARSFPRNPASIEFAGDENDAKSLAFAKFSFQYAPLKTKILCYKLNDDNTQDIWFTTYDTNSSSLQLLKGTLPKLQNMNPFNPPDQSIKVVELWRTTNTVNIHAHMFYYDSDNGLIRCTRCADTSNLATVTFDDMTISLDGQTVTNQVYSFPCDLDFWKLNISASDNITNLAGCKFGFMNGSIILVGSYITNYVSFVCVAIDVSTGSEVKRETIYGRDWYNQNIVPQKKHFINGSALVFHTFGYENIVDENYIGSKRCRTLVFNQDRSFLVTACYGGYSDESVKNSNIWLIESVDKSSTMQSWRLDGTNTQVTVLCRTDYLATVNNLETSITKTDADVLKVFYELTYVEESDG